MDQNTVTLILLGIIVFVILLGLILIRLGGRKADWQTDLIERLDAISRSSNDSRLKLIELDKLAAYALQQKFNQPQQSLGQILKTYRSRFSKQQLDQIWSAHKLRNKMVHEVDFKPQENQLRQQLKNITSFLESLI